GQPNFLGGSLVTRFLPDGTSDSTFGSAGSVTLSSVFAALAIQPDGKIDVAVNSQIPNGKISATNIGFMVDRLLPDEPQIGSLTAGANANGSMTLYAGNIADS